MNGVRIFVRYGGVWDEKERKYVGGSFKGTIVSKQITYKDLLAELYDIAGVDSSKYDMMCVYHVKFENQSVQIEVSNERDVKFYLTTENILDYPLCLSFQSKLVGVGGLQVCNNSTSESNGVENLNVPIALDTIDEEAVEMALGEDNEESTRWNSYDNSPWENVQINNLSCEAHDHIQLEGSISIEDIEGTSSREKHARKGIWLEESSTSNELDVGQMFSCKRELSMKLNVLAMKIFFEFRVKKSTQNILYVKCIDDKCKWRLRGVKLKGSNEFKISKYANVHSCTLEVLNHDHRQAKSWVVGELIKSKFKEAGRQYKPRDIIADMRQDYGVNLSYEKAWRCRENAFMRVRGSPEESYNILSRYGEALKLANPGTIYDIELEDGCFFKYLFMALGPCIRGFLNCIRPVIVMDGTFLKCKYRGTLVIATCLDGNNQIYPLAFGIVDRETDASMQWFLEKLRGAVGEPADLVFVSDRNASISKGIASVFPTAFHCLCVQHLRQNLNSKFKNQKAESLFYIASRAYRESKFQDAWGRIQAFDNGIGKYLEEVGVSRWARTQCPKKRYNLMTTNIAECMNGILKEPRELPVATLLEHIRALVQRWFWERREEASKVTFSLTKWAEAILHESHDQSSTMKVDPIDCYQCHVKDVDTEEIVNLNTMECTCNKFQLDQLPCAHAIAAARDRGINVYTLCSHYYTNECLLAAYADAIFPVGNASEWKTSDDYVNLTVLPPKVVARVGRRRRVRIPLVGETQTLLKCGRCNERGHNRLTCNNPIAYTNE